ncbi:hypothetical protein RRG08_054228 [Elysia crispata]|uniref:Uncharacterized protein n=1 Tax=Elysia crispata TaxID=231223 RepID=A0AAE1CW39_9GAST|nr:hypothetical protein RRG08_054228 [Elysia crispata]
MSSEHKSQREARQVTGLTSARSASKSGRVSTLTPASVADMPGSLRLFIQLSQRAQSNMSESRHDRGIPVCVPKIKPRTL